MTVIFQTEGNLERIVKDLEGKWGKIAHMPEFIQF